MFYLCFLLFLFLFCCCFSFALFVCLFGFFLIEYFIFIIIFLFEFASLFSIYLETQNPSKCISNMLITFNIQENSCSQTQSIIVSFTFGTSRFVVRHKGRRCPRVQGYKATFIHSFIYLFHSSLTNHGIPLSSSSTAINTFTKIKLNINTNTYYFIQLLARFKFN